MYFSRTILPAIALALFLAGCAADQVQPEPRAVNPMGLSGKMSPEAEMYYSQARVLWKEKRLALGVRNEECLDPQKAVELLTKCIQLEPAYPDAYIRRAMALNDLKRFDSAFNDATSALRLHPKAEYYAIRSFSLVHMGRLEAARKDINRALHSNNSSALVWRHAALVSFAENKTEQGCEELQSACEYGDCYSLSLAQSAEQCPQK